MTNKCKMFMRIPKLVNKTVIIKLIMLYTKITMFNRQIIYKIRIISNLLINQISNSQIIYKIQISNSQIINKIQIIYITLIIYKMLINLKIIKQIIKKLIKPTLIT